MNENDRFITQNSYFSSFNHFYAHFLQLFQLCLKAHHSNAAPTTDRSFAYAKAQAIRKSGGNPDTSSYFRRDPYGT